MSSIEEFFEKAVAAGYIPQIPMNYDAVAYKIYTGYLENKTDELTAEVAELRTRLDKAVELPCKIGDKLYYVNTYTRVPQIETFDIRAIGIESNEPCVRLFTDGDWVFEGSDEDVFFNREAAEERLKELQEKEK